MSYVSVCSSSMASLSVGESVQIPFNFSFFAKKSLSLDSKMAPSFGAVPDFEDVLGQEY